MSTPVALRYWPCYCEENVWHLSGEAAFAGSCAQVVFISNEKRQVALWGQRAAERPNGRLPLIWDYHVVLLARDSFCRNSDGEWQIWDPDTILGCPLAARVYLERTFPASGILPGAYAPRFRLVPAAGYRRDLQSDRSHMLLDDGTYSSPPPPWPPIGSTSNLMRYVDVGSQGPGRVLDLEGLLRRLEAHGEWR